MHNAIPLLSASILLFRSLAAQTVVQVDAFNSIELPGGGHVVFQRAPTQRVSLVAGSLDYTRLHNEGGRLVIDKCFRKCPPGYRLQLEILTPSVNRVSLANGGSIQSRGSFPRQSDLEVAVSNGGTVDVRTIIADRVAASVNQGGRILTVPQLLLSARIDNGGAITYWGDARVKSSVEHDGVVIKGMAEEFDLPVAEVGVFMTPELFAPGTISSADSGESFGSLSRDGREFYYTIHRANFSGHRIVVARFDGTQWKRGETLPFSGRYNDREPKLSPDGRRLYFSSNRPAVAGDTARRRTLDLWFVEREPGGAWGGAPHHLEAPVNTDAQEFCPVVTSDGTLYFISNRSGGIGANGQMYNVWRASPIDPAAGRYAAPENLGPAINTGVETNVYVSPDARVMLVSRDSAPDTFGDDDLYVSEFRGGAWEPMRHLPAGINSPEYDYGPLLSPDGRWLFFTSARRGTADIYRVDARALDLASRGQSAPASAMPPSPSGRSPRS